MDCARSILFYIYTYVLLVCYNKILRAYNAGICHGFQIVPHACSCVIEKLSVIQCRSHDLQSSTQGGSEGTGAKKYVNKNHKLPRVEANCPRRK